jgi:hypothetical protein
MNKTNTITKTKYPYVYFPNNDRGEVGIGGDYDYDTYTREGTINLLEEGGDDDGRDLSIFLHFKDAEMLRKIAMQLNQVADWMENTNAQE